jgi:hypothetical protein
MPKQPIFHMLRPQRLAQQDIVPEIDLRAGESAPHEGSAPAKHWMAQSATVQASNSSSA